LLFSSFFSTQILGIGVNTLVRLNWLVDGAGVAPFLSIDIQIYFCRLHWLVAVTNSLKGQLYCGSFDQL
jgi:hypothetical protein